MVCMKDVKKNPMSKMNLKGAARGGGSAGSMSGGKSAGGKSAGGGKMTPVPRAPGANNGSKSR